MPATSSSTADIAVVGAGLVGLATAHALVSRGFRVVVFEKERRVAPHQSSHNSGVIHSGLYYAPGSARATLCVAGRRKMVEFCARHGIAHEVCGKLVVATTEDELSRLETLIERGRRNGLAVRRLDRVEIAGIEPNVAGIAAAHVPEAGIADYPGVAAALQRLIQHAGGTVCLTAGLRSARERAHEVVVETDAGTWHVAALVGCAGLHADRVARRCGLTPDVVIAPFRGEYYQLRPERAALVRHLVYPVPDPRFPFLGVHFTRMVHGGVEAGPNAVMALAREGYRWRDVDLGDLAAVLTSPGVLRFCSRHLSTGVAEIRRSLSRRRFAASLARLVPAVTADDLLPGGAGVRAMAVTPDGRLVDDFQFLESPRMVHVLNAPSPAATASLAIGETLADRVAAAVDGGRHEPAPASHRT